MALVIFLCSRYLAIPVMVHTLVMCDMVLLIIFNFQYRINVCLLCDHVAF